MVKLARQRVQRFSNTQVGSEPFAKFSTLLLFPTGYKSVDLIRSAWKRSVLIVQPLQFHDSTVSLQSSRPSGSDPLCDGDSDTRPRQMSFASELSSIPVAFLVRFYKKGCQEKSSPSTGEKILSRDPAHFTTVRVPLHLRERFCF